MDEDLTHRLAAAVSPSGLTHKGSVVVPATVDAVIAALRICAEAGTPVRASSGGAGVAEPPPAGGNFHSGRNRFLCPTRAWRGR